MKVRQFVNFLGKEVMTTGVVIRQAEYEGNDCYLVHFEHEGVKYAGWWIVKLCKVVDNGRG